MRNSCGERLAEGVSLAWQELRLLKHVSCSAAFVDCDTVYFRFQQDDPVCDPAPEPHTGTPPGLPSEPPSYIRFQQDDPVCDPTPAPPS
eukprot:1190228-Prorocentrum_minimum.AAC.1